MARCDEGYRCEVCGRDVEAITESDLYLRYVLGEVPLERLHLQRERHISCNPALAQFIVAAIRTTPPAFGIRFLAGTAEDAFRKRHEIRRIIDFSRG